MQLLGQLTLHRLEFLFIGERYTQFIGVVGDSLPKLREKLGYLADAHTRMLRLVRYLLEERGSALRILTVHLRQRLVHLQHTILEQIERTFRADDVVHHAVKPVERGLVTEAFQCVVDAVDAFFGAVHGPPAAPVRELRVFENVVDAVHFTAALR